MKRNLPLLKRLCLVVALSLLVNFCMPETTHAAYCNCYKDYTSSLGKTLLYTKTVTIDKKVVKRTYGPYEMVKNAGIKNIQPGAYYAYSTGTKFTKEASLSASVVTSIGVGGTKKSPSIGGIEITWGELKLGASTSTFTVVTDVSPKSIATKTRSFYIAPYVRTAYKHYDVVKTTVVRCTHGNVMETITTKATAKKPYMDDAAFRWGGSYTRSDLKAVLYVKKDDKLFTWGQ